MIVLMEEMQYKFPLNHIVHTKIRKEILKARL
jgi:hypothetical protein